MRALCPTQILQLLTRLLAVTVVAALPACKNTPEAVGGDGVTLSDLEPAIPLPEIGPPDVPERPAAVHAIVQRIDIPLDQSTDDAWAVADELAFPAITRGMWQHNGMRLGLIAEEDVESFAAHMPTVLELFETQVFTSTHPLPVMQTARLRRDVRIPVDLTAPPAAPDKHTIVGGDDGRLQLLARLEVEGEKVFLILTPHHYQPRDVHLQPRDILEKELDGRIYDELAVRIELRDDRLLVVGLYWPWPIEEQLDDTVVDEGALPQIDTAWLTHVPPPLADDPAAPPPHLRMGVPDRAEGEPGTDEDDAIAGDTDAVDPPGEPTTLRHVRVAPPLPVHLGRALLTGTRARQPVQSLLLISIPPRPDAPPEAGTDTDDTASVDGVVAE